MMAHARSKPRRAGARWREGAPAYVLDCFDHGPESGADRYTVFLEPETHGYLGWWVSYLGLSDNPAHPGGVSQWGEFTLSGARDFRRREGKRRIRWLDLPENVRAHIAHRMEA